MLRTSKFLVVHTCEYNLRGFCRTTKCKCIGRKGCPSCRCLRPAASAPVFCSILYNVLNLLLQYATCFCNPTCSNNAMLLLASAVCYVLLYNVFLQCDDCPKWQLTNVARLHGQFCIYSSPRQLFWFQNEIHFTLTTELLLSFSGQLPICPFCKSTLFSG